MRNLTVTILIMMLYGIGGNIQSQELITKLAGSFDYASADNLGHFYLVKNEEIIKTDELGKKLFSYSNPVLGNITHIDSSDPFRILLFYKEYNRIVFLDNTLSPIGDPIALDNINIYSPLSIAQSKRGGFWVLDAASGSLYLFDQNLNQTLNVKPTGIISDNSTKWIPALEFKESLYFCIEGNSVHQFDLFGTRIKRIPVKAMDISPMNNELLLILPNDLVIYRPENPLSNETLDWDIDSWEKIVISVKHALVKEGTNWLIYRLKKT